MAAHVSALKELLKEPSNRDLIKPTLLDFDDVQDVSDEEIEDGAKGKAKIGDEDLSKPFKEVLKCPFTRRIVEFSSPGHRLPANAKIYDGTGDPEDHIGRFVRIGNQGEWLMPEKFLNKFGMLKACDKDPTEISKIVRMANETLPHFKERWVSESNAIPNVPELMQISSFISSHKCPELAKRFSDNVPKTVDKMLKREDDYLRSEEAFRNTELPRGEFQWKDIPAQWRKTTITDEKWMNVPIIFPPVLARDLSEEALVVDAEVEGYLVQRIHIDEGDSVEIMLEHCFNMLHLSIRSRVATLVSQTLVVFECRRKGKKQAVEPPKERKAQDTISPTNQEPSDMAGVPKRIIKHSLNANPLEKPVKTFDNLKRINMKLNPKKCSFGAEEGKFLGYMVTSEGSKTMVPRQTQDAIDHQKDCKEEWVLYTNGASSAKGFVAGLVLISPTKTEYTYALRLNFESTNNQAEYEAILAGLRIAKKMGVQSLSVNVDSKLVASQINGSYEAYRKGGKCVPRAQEDDLGSVSLNNAFAERDPVCVPISIKRSGKRSTVSCKTRKATPSTLCKQNTS
nr:reverse transcriptase domain-containing protein [Tanacetum cinerariifolium]